MKILRINDIPGNMRGGMAHYIKEVNNCLEKEGHEIICIYKEDIKTGRNARLRRFLAPFLISHLIQEKVKKQAFDVIEIHEPLGAWYVRARKKNPKLPPVVISVYGLEERAFESRLLVDKYIGKSTSFLSKVGAKSIIAQANYALKYADHVLVETTEDKEWLIKKIGRNYDSVTIQPGGVKSVFSDFEPTNSPNIIFLGSWIERKGITVFSRVITRVLDEFPDVRVTIAGCGCDEKSVFKYFPKKNHGNLKVISALSNDLETSQALSLSGIFFFPSNFEGIPLSLLEAASAGCAILTTNVCGMKDFISDGVNGLLCLQFDEDGFFNNLIKLLRQPSLRKNLGKMARIRAREFTWEKSAFAFMYGCRMAISNSRNPSAHCREWL